VLRIERSDFELIYAISLGSSLSAAAHRLGVTKPAVSQRLARLEEIIGHALVKRGRPVKFTPAGERFLSAAKIVVFGVATLESDLREIGGGIRPLKIMTNLSVAIDDLPQVIEHLHESDKNLQVIIKEGAINETIKEVLAGSIDAGIIFNKSQASGLLCHPYRTEKFCIIAPISHQISGLEITSLAHATQYDFVGTGRSHNISAVIEAEAQREGMSIRYAMHTSGYEMQAHIVGTTNIGIAIVLGNVARRYARIYPIKIIELSDEWASGEYVICTKEFDFLSPACIEFIRLMKLRFSGAILQ
jgi:DNA-binding transcriptional LysR family regulator